MAKKKKYFGKFYFIYVLVLAALIAALSFYVRSILQEYEDFQPELAVKQAQNQLLQEAAQTGFWDKQGFSSLDFGPFEEQYKDAESAQKRFFALVGSLDTVPVRTNEAVKEDELSYNIQFKDKPLAKVQLRSDGDMITKLGIFSYRKWLVESMEPVLEKKDYTLSLPSGFTAVLNGIQLGESDIKSVKGNTIEYQVPGLYFPPDDLVITSPEGTNVASSFKGSRIIPEIFNYSLTLPSALDLTLNGNPLQGEPQSGNMVLYEVVSLTKPDLQISDHYGNTVSYEGGSKLPLSFAYVTVPSDYDVQVDGRPVASGDVYMVPNPEIANFREFVPDVKHLSSYDIAVLKADSVIEVLDANGQKVALEEGKHVYDLSSPEPLAEIPQEIASAVNVLDVAHNWSLFLSRDYAFSNLSKSLLKGSYQYDVANKYAHSVDITFTSKHTLKNPPFTGDSVTNFRQLSPTCFSVDISFVKHMHIANGLDMDDAMNDRFYFVYYDDTDNGKDDPAWKLASMIEIVAGAEE